MAYLGELSLQLKGENEKYIILRVRCPKQVDRFRLYAVPDLLSFTQIIQSIPFTAEVYACS